MLDDSLIDCIISAALLGAKKVMESYESYTSVEWKSDGSPLTAADLASNEAIVGHLSKNYPDIVIISEENNDVPYQERMDAEFIFLVDPLDGTKEFIHKNGEFTVNIALVARSERAYAPIFGCIVIPVKKLLYWGGKGTGAFRIGTENVPELDPERFFRQENKRAVRLPCEKPDSVTVVASRSHANEQTDSIMAGLRNKYAKVDSISAGSSLKLCYVADGTADCYPRAGSTMEWDIAAGQAICEGAGASVLDLTTGDTLVYNKRNLINPHFIAKSRRFLSLEGSV